MVAIYNTLEWHITFSYRLSYLNYDITCIIVLKITFMYKKVYVNKDSYRKLNDDSMRKIVIK